MIPTIAAGERDVLLEAARKFDAWQGQTSTLRQSRRPRWGKQGERPGDDFNARADWAEILEPNGWQRVDGDGRGVDYWCRPGKDFGISATTNHENRDLLYVFSSNAAPFEDGRGYTKFHAFSLLEHEGDFEAAARDLASKGYGKRGRQRRRRQLSLFERYSRRRRC